MLPRIKGNVAWVFHEDNYDIDNIIGIDNIKVKDIKKLKEVCMSSYDPDFRQTVKEGDVLVGGRNFGYGHPHWGAFKAMRALGISALFAESFYPGFYRGETTNGFTLIEVPDITKHITKGDIIELDWNKEVVTINGDKTLKCKHIPKKTKDIVELGGIIPYLRKTRLKTGGTL